MAHGDITKLRACLFRTSEYSAGDEIIFKYEGNLRGIVRRVNFGRGRVRYVVAVCVECDVPERFVVGAEGEKGGG